MYCQALFDNPLTPWISVDFGGSLTKVVYFDHEDDDRGRVVFKMFDAENISGVAAYILELFSKFPTKNRKLIKATGGGAFKHANYFKETLDIELLKEDEMESLIAGLDFLVTNIPFESFCFIEKSPILYEQAESSEHHYPCLLVNIGSGVSMIKVDHRGSFERISGTSLGGGTFWGLMKLLGERDHFSDALEISENGNNKNVDLLVGDIYGSGYSKIGLSADVIASSFGKVFKLSDAERQSEIHESDISQSLLYMLSNNIAQIAYLNAKLYGIERIYFSGFFIRGHASTMKCLSYGVRWWSKGEMKAFFLRHEGYLGSLGALLLGESPMTPACDTFTFEMASKPAFAITDAFNPSDDIHIYRK